MKTFAPTPKTLDVASRIIWFKAPEQALAHPIELMSYALRYATFTDMTHLLDIIGKEGLQETLDNCLPGVVDARSWAYWNLKAGRVPPPMPVRKLPQY